jgi:hypothetical protein
MVMTPRERGLLAVPGIRKTCARKKKEFIENYNKNPKHCKRCGVILSCEQRRNIFCSHKCAGISNNRPGRHTKGVPFSKCTRCGVGLNHHGKLCMTCLNQLRSDKIIEAVKSGNYSSFKIVRKYLIVVRGHKCEDCGLEMWKNLPIYLETHHIDGNSENNIPSNLKLLCPNCHSLTSNFKSKNKGNGKRQRLRWGKNK